MAEKIIYVFDTTLTEAALEKLEEEILSFFLRPDEIEPTITVPFTPKTMLSYGQTVYLELRGWVQRYVIDKKQKWEFSEGRYNIKDLIFQYPGRTEEEIQVIDLRKAKLKDFLTEVINEIHKKYAECIQKINLKVQLSKGASNSLGDTSFKKVSIDSLLEKKQELDALGSYLGVTPLELLTASHRHLSDQYLHFPYVDIDQHLYSGSTQSVGDRISISNNHTTSWDLQFNNPFCPSV